MVSKTSQMPEEPAGNISSFALGLGELIGLKGSTLDYLECGRQNRIYVLIFGPESRLEFKY